MASWIQWRRERIIYASADDEFTGTLEQADY